MSLTSILKKKATQGIQAVKKLSAFSAGMFIGVCYGSIVGTLTAYALLAI